VEIQANENVVLAKGQTAPTKGQTLKLDRLTLASGTLRFRITSGVNLVASGPAEIEFIDAMHMRLVRGQVTADVEPQARGFTVVTPNGRVVDLGTRFGVGVAPEVGADVVVFQGKVEVHRADGNAAHPPLVSLLGGEAVRLNRRGTPTRIDSVVTGPGAHQWVVHGGAQDQDAVITAVTDNNRQRWSNRFYPIMRRGMNEGVFAWPYDVNKPRWWSLDGASLPAELEAADVVQTLNEELNNQNLELTLRLARACRLYVFYEEGATPPGWLEENFTDTGERLVLSPDSPTLPGDPGTRGSYQRVFRIWQRLISGPGEYQLGALLKENVHSPPFYMYGIAAKALDANQQPTDR
jgi:hypothetical protein